jgi:hypothetical protein
MVEGGLIGAEILRQSILRHVREHVGDGESRVLGKGTVGKRQYKFGAIRLQSLDRMGNTRWEIPEITGFDVGDEVISIVVHGRNACLASQHKRPFGFLVPMQFAYTASGEPHVDASDRLGGRQFLTSRDQLPSRIFTWVPENEYRRLGIAPSSVSGGYRKSGFSISRAGSRGPRMVAPFFPSMGCAVLSWAAAAAVAPSIIAPVRSARREVWGIGVVLLPLLLNVIPETAFLPVSALAKWRTFPDMPSSTARRSSSTAQDNTVRDEPFCINSQDIGPFWENCNEVLLARLRGGHRPCCGRGRGSKPHAGAGPTGLCNDGRAALANA